MFLRHVLLSLTCIGWCLASFAKGQERSLPNVMPFGQSGKLKMLYDARQRPQCVYLKGKLYIVYNGDAQPTSNERGRAHPMLVIYDPQSREFSKATRLGPSDSDHHFSPIIWADSRDCLHVLYGCHKTPGTHLISRSPAGDAADTIVWDKGPPIADKLSYPTAFRIHGDRELIYYRTDGHTSSWTYRISQDNGRTWQGPTSDVTDLDSRGRLDWSAYQTKRVDPAGKFLHVAYTDYDDNKHSPDPRRFYNPRYDQEVSNEWKYNLSYIKIDLQTQQVLNFRGDLLKTPIDIDYSQQHCQIWDTEGRGAGVPPAVSLDERGQPAMLHVLSEEDLSTHRYYFVRLDGGSWKQTPICHSSHQWNSGHLSRDIQGTWHAYVVAGETYLKGGYMDRHGGGRIEEWVSHDDGSTWSFLRQLSPDTTTYADWRFNNVQPVVRPDGSEVEGMLLFYGWPDPALPTARAFLLHE